MSRDDIKAQIFSMLSEFLGPEEGARITEETQVFVPDVFMDSLDRADFAMRMEEAFAVKLEDEHIRLLRTVDNAAGMIENAIRLRDAAAG